jgi:hypothetical protein
MIIATAIRTARNTGSKVVFVPNIRLPQQIDFPFGGDHSLLESDHEPPGGIHADRARPGLSCKMSAENIEKGVPFFSVQTAAIGRNVGIIGIQLSDQLRVFLNDDPQDKIRGRPHVTLLKLPPAARQRGG